MAKVNGSAEILDIGQARARLRPADLKASEFATIGAYFSAVREAAGYSIEDIADRTHIKPAYLNAIELMRLDDLPSRPFALGFVKTYADALGVDAQAAVAKFKETGGGPAREAPVVHQPAEPHPVAVDERERPLLSLIGFIAVLGFILFCAIMIAMP
ncbi:MAG: helix-turn-helix domain-containing protein, partial [Parvularculaceae bacterium]|nr:helix-turn-helix domain-containing protein [Parvularculaceae bacterium]